MSEKHVLIIDGDKQSAQSIANLLQSHEFKVDLAHSGNEGLQKASQFPDLILLERSLPDTNSLEICQNIRNNKSLRHISIIVLSTDGELPKKVESLHSGADDYIVKPVEDDELIARIEAVLRRNHAFRQFHGKKSALVTELKEILNKELITPFYQPIYSMRTLKPIGLEALSRPPSTGLIDNAEFLFKTALILDMYSEVEMLCWRVAVNHWKETVNQEKLFLNCTPYFIESGKLSEEFLRDLHVDLDCIVLEITERTAIQNEELFIKELNALRKLGVKIAVDDVGSGFASLDTVVEIRPEIVKIDRHLVRALYSDELRYNIMQAVVSFCKKSKMMTVAEGIEEEKELQIVSDLGVDAVQGYFLAKPTADINVDIFSRKFGEEL